MKNKIDELLVNLYELEGLLLLAKQKEEIPEDLKALITKKWNAVESVVKPMAPREDFQFYALEEEPEEVEVEVREPATPTEPEVRNVAPESASKRVAAPCSLNDKFLFIREIFSGSGSRFDNALAELARFENADEAVAYFEGKYDIDPESEAGERFLDMVRNNAGR